MSQTDSELDSLLQHVQDTWQLKKSLDAIQQKKHQLQSQVNDLTTQELSLKKQLKESKKLMDHCLQTGEDAVEAKMVRSTQEYQRWEHDYRSYTERMYDLSAEQLHALVSSKWKGALGATGA